MPSLVGDGMRRHADADLHLLQSLLVAHDDARNNLWLRAVKSILRRLHVLEMLGHQFHELFVLQISGGTDNQIAGSKPLIVESQHRIPLEFLDVSFVPRMGLPSG